MNAICLVIDRLQAGYVGCYGNAWVGTPGIDRLAAESFVLDGAYIDSPELESLYRSFWLGSHALARLSAVDREAGRIVNPSDALPGVLAAAGVSTTLVTDAAEVAHHPLATAFGRREEVPTHGPDCAGAELENTQAAKFFTAALDVLRDAKPPFFLWLHSQGMAGPWDAPRELRERYAAEGDPEPPDFVRPPAIRLPDDPDPDELLGIRQAYAAQVALVDSCVEALHDALRENQWAADTLFMVLSARGFPLGVHGIVGSGQEADKLYGELTGLPWLLRFPDGLGAADRSSGLVQPADLFATLLDGWRLPPRGGRSDSPSYGGACGQSLLRLARGLDFQPAGQAGSLPHDRAVMVSSSGERALRTPAWYARFPSPESAELYVKPDDRWEINDVTRRCPEVAEVMRLALGQFEAACGLENESLGVQMPALDDLLVDGQR
jgi:arylsulfatase A-like enzyme